MDILPIDKIKRFTELCRNCRKAVVVSHSHPDGDALGCVSATYHYLTSTLGKDAVVLVSDEIPQTLKFILNKVKRTGDTSVLDSCDLLVSLDLSNLSRTEPSFEKPLKECGAAKILIDHHLNPATDEFDLVFSDINVSSASELLYWILKEAQGGSIKGITKPALTAIMCGMTTDTNNFANSVWPSTLQMASQLLEAGVDRDDIIRRIFNSYRTARVKGISYLLDNCLQLRDSYAYIIITKELKRKFGLKDGELEGLVNIPLSVKHIKMSMTFTQDDGFYRVSLRSKREIPVNVLASEHFHGGGHRQASGGKVFVPGDIASAQDLPSHIESCAARFLQDIFK